MSDFRLHVPSLVGPAALSELVRVPWGELAHAYGIGKVGPDLCDDVAATLRRLGDSDATALGESLNALYSNLCHQGTIYEATAYAAPFLAAFAAGVESREKASRMPSHPFRMRVKCRRFEHVVETETVSSQWGSGAENSA